MVQSPQWFSAEEGLCIVIEEPDGRREEVVLEPGGCDSQALMVAVRREHDHAGVGL